MELRPLKGFYKEIGGHTLRWIMIEMDISCLDPLGDEEKTNFDVASTFAATHLAVIIKEHRPQVFLEECRFLDIVALLIKQVLCPKDLWKYVIRRHQFGLRRSLRVQILAR